MEKDFTPSPPPRWATRALAFAAITFYGVAILSAGPHLASVLDAVFPSSSLSLPAHAALRHRNGGEELSLASPYHPHINAIQRGGHDEMPPSVHISFELHDPRTVPLRNEFNPWVTGHCPLGRLGNGELRMGVLPPSLVRVESGDGREENMRSGRVLDFTTSISTDLKILFIGDSVMLQFSQAIDEMLDAKANRTRTAHWHVYGKTEGGTVVAPTRGGGVASMWRMTALLSQSAKYQPPAPEFGGGWNDTEVQTLTGHPYMDATGQNKTVGRFDVVVYRVMHGWMDIDDITHDRIVEAIELSHELLGASTMVLMTIPFSNNVINGTEMLRIREVNRMIRDIARGWHPREDTGVRHVLIMEYGQYSNHLIWSNARHLGYNLTHPLQATEDVFDLEGLEFLLDRLDNGSRWPPSIAHVCSNLSSVGLKKDMCNRNFIFKDGMHVCPETVASRFGAGVACLIGCAQNGRAGRDGPGSAADRSLLDESIRACERSCNTQFMSVLPVDEAWIDSNTILASCSWPMSC